MKKKIWIVIIISVQFLVLSSVMTDAGAFLNGNIPTGTTFNPYDPTELAAWRMGGEYYGTHDWIAEAGLDAVLQDSKAQKWKDKDGVNFWNERRIIIFLIGTEAPDMGKSQLRMTVDGKTIYGFKSSSRHNIHFVGDISIYGPKRRMKTSSTKVLPLIDNYETKAFTALKAGKCDLAAFYLGFIVHLISDLSSFLHVFDRYDVGVTWLKYQEDQYQPNSFDEVTALLRDVHINYEKNLLKYTRNRGGNVFSYPKNFEVSPNGIKNLRQIATETAFNTRFDTSATVSQINGEIIPPTISEGPYNALWMFHHSFKFDSYISRINYVSIENQDLIYRNKVQEHLNNAVKSAAQVLNHFGLYWNTKTTRECKGCCVNKAPAQGMSISKSLMIAVSMFMVISIVMSTFPILLAQQIKEILTEKELIV